MSTAPETTPAEQTPPAGPGVYPIVRTGTPGAPGSGVTAPSFPEIEQGVLRHWEAGDTFRKSVENRPAGTNGENEYVFFDGPPFANGLPHYGHLLTGYVKDVVPRYQTMRGKRVERRFGWDTHGLPAELEAMRQLGQTALRDVAQQLSGRHGERDTRRAGAAGELTGATRPWAFGDTEPWDVTRTITNAITRTASTGGDPGHAPARATVEAKLAGPQYRVEISIIAATGA